MAEELLSQDEIDALLHGVGEEDEAEDRFLHDDRARTFDFNSQDRIVRGNMPALEMINERFAREFRLSLFNLLRRKSEVTVAGIRVVKFGEYLQGLTTPTSLNIVQVQPLRGSALFALDPRLVFKLVDHFFGGDGRFYTKPESRDFTLSEQRVTQKILQRLYADLKKAWEPVLDIRLQHVTTEIDPQFVNLVTPTEVVVLSTFEIDLEGSGGELHFCFPYSMLEPIREMLGAGPQSDGSEKDERWSKTLQHDLQFAKVQLTADLLETDLTLKDILDLQAGDIINVELPRELTLFGEDVPLFRCSYGTFDEHYAIKINEVFRPNPNLG